MEPVVQALPLLHQGGLCQLEHQLTRFKVAARQGGGQLLREALSHEVLDRDVHADPLPAFPSRPLGGLPACLDEHPGTERHDEPGLLTEREELLGQQQPALGVPPAHERLRTHHFPPVQVDDRLVVQLELVAL